MERTRATSTNILELKIVQLKVPADSKPRFGGHIFPDLLMDLMNVKEKTEEHRAAVKLI